MDVGKAFTFVTEDASWLTKIGIGAIIVFTGPLLLGIPLLLLVGYQLAVTRNVMNGMERPLPEWEDFGKLFMDGLYITLARIVYTLPFILLICIAVVVSILPAMSAESGNDGLTAVLTGTAALVWLVVACLAVLFGIAFFFIAPAISIQYVRTGEFGACFRFGEVIGIVREHMSDIVIAAVVLIIVNFVLQATISALGATGCGLILAIPLGLAAYPYLAATTGHLYGQIAARIAGKGAAY
ncbi:MAG: DUF4013 domain-containing protein [Anaerolineales bacterium]|nr:DUF4013 domain-containing protein [Anaerolineales bacterium]